MENTRVVQAKGLFEIPAYGDKRVRGAAQVVIVQLATVNGEARDDGYWPDLELGFYEVGDELRMDYVLAKLPSPEVVAAAKVWLDRYETEPTFAEVIEFLVKDDFEAYTKEKMAALMAEE